ncbi:MAG TPA: secretin N-terminal domain-containing protein [Meiothermus sp.]|nr:secretin N-terminal domain-containing protein [Meiothermus sp.]
MKRLLAMLALLSFGLASFGWAGSLPTDSRFDAPVRLNIANIANSQTVPTLPLDVVLEALAKSVGLQPLIYREFPVDGNAANAKPTLPNIKLDFEGRPFRQVWDLIFNTYGVQLSLDYQIIGTGTVVVAPSALITSLSEAQQRVGDRSRVLYLVSIPPVVYIDGTKIDYEKAKTWVKDNFIPFATTEFGSLSVNWIVVQQGNTLAALSSIVGTTPQHNRFQDTLAKGRYTYEVLAGGATPVGQQTQVNKTERLYTLQNVSFADLQNFLLGQLPSLEISVVPTNPKAAYIRGSDADLKKLDELLKTADLARAFKRPYTLQNLTFEQASSRLQPLLTGDLKGIGLEPIPGNPNGLFANATEAQHTQLAEVIKAVDTPIVQAPTSEPVVRRIYTLNFANAARVADFLRKEVKGITAEVIEGQPVVVVRGTEKQQQEVADLVVTLDKPTGEQAAAASRTQRVYKLKFANAPALVEALSKVGGGSATANTQPSTSSGLPSLVADPSTNSIIAVGSDAQLRNFEVTLAQLDVPKQQVQLQVRIQAVNSSVIRELGIKWETISGGNLVASILEKGLSLIFDATRSLASLNIRATLNALESQNLSRRISDANLIVENGYGNDTSDLRQASAAGAELKAGGKLLIVTSTSGDNPQQNVREFDVGLTLRLRPRITPDGQIILEVYTQTGGQPEVLAPDRTFLPVNSTLSNFRLKDGQTVVMGGLVQTTSKNTENKVPLLGDIPLIGALFKQTTVENSQEELIIIITANIVKEQPMAGQ